MKKQKKQRIASVVAILAFGLIIACFGQSFVQGVDSTKDAGDKVNIESVVGGAEADNTNNKNTAEGIENTASKDTGASDITTIPDSVFDTKAKEGVYKFSEDTKDTNLPFIRYATDRIIMDKELKNIGSSFSTKSIEVVSPIKNLQVLFATDSARINAEMDFPIIFAGSDVVIDAPINKTVIIFAGNSVTFTQNAKIAEDVICYTNKVNVKGEISGSLLGSVKEVEITGKINKDLRVLADNVIIADNTNVSGNILIQTYNNAISIADKYPNAVVKVFEKGAEKVDFVKIILKGITTCLVFTLIYILIKRYSKKQILQSIYEKVKKYPGFVVAMGAITTLGIPLVLFLLVLLMAAGLSVIALPTLIAYMSFIIVVSMLSTFIVGSLIFTHIKGKYLKEESVGYDIVGVFFTFAVLYVLARLPYIGNFVTAALVMIAVGIAITYIIKKNVKQVEVDG
ncbi:MAG: hypothetical protein RSE00_05435 [Clostridia bacterium]